jgi:hypothetical protein
VRVEEVGVGWVVVAWEMGEVLVKVEVEALVTVVVEGVG